MADNTVAGLKNIRGRRRTPKMPDDFGDKGMFLDHMRKLFAHGMDADRENREQALEDLRFFSGDQWSDADKEQRTRKRKPTLTINRLPAFVQTFIANRRLNEVGIKVHPDYNGSKEVARIRQELIRGIQRQSRAPRVYAKAFENEVICGIGNFQVILDYAYDDVFEQDIKLAKIANPLAVVWDPSGVDETGNDAGWCFVVDKMDSGEFTRLWPHATAGLPTNDTRLLGYDLKEETLSANENEVEVAAFWRVRTETRLLAMVDEGSVEDVTDVDEAIWLPRVVTDSDGDPIIRESLRKYAEMYLITGSDILEGPYRLPIHRVPVFKCVGWEVNVGDYRRRFGLVRFLRDPQMLHNYWRSVIAEKLMRSPKQTWIASSDAVEGREKEWRNSHLSDDALLVYNGDAGSIPKQVDPPAMEDALVQEASLSAQDIKDVSNIHEASLGMQGNEVSGKGILARQRVSEAGLVIYNDNMNDSIEESGIVINQLIPVVYDTPRVVKVLGEESDDFELKKINDATDAESYDITTGKYLITVSTGPSFATKRIEAADSMLNMVNAMPDTMAVAADEIVAAQDWPGAEKIAARLRMTLPPGMVNPEDLPPHQQQMLAAQAQAAQAQQQREQRVQDVEMGEKQARAFEAVARAQQALAQARKVAVEAEMLPEVEAIDAQAKQLNAISQTVNALDNLQRRGDDNG